MFGFLQWQDATGLVLSVLAAFYLIFVLVFPEKF